MELNETPVVTINTGTQTTERVLSFIGKVHQKGLTYKDKQHNVHLADPNNNDCYVQVRLDVTTKGNEPINIAKVAGSLANQAFNWAKGMSAAKGIHKQAGFFLDIEASYTENGETGTIGTATTGRLLLSQASDAASFIARSILLMTDTENSEALLTGNFVVTPEGKLLMNRLGYSDAAAALPFASKVDLMEHKRKAIKKEVRETMKEQLMEAGLYKEAKKAPVAAE